MKYNIPTEFLSFKRILFSLIIISGLAFLQSCTKPGCTDATADNYDFNAKSDDGSCICSRDKFLGNYRMFQSCDESGESRYGATITPGKTGKNTVYISNFYNNSVDSILGTTTGTILTISNQKLNSEGVYITAIGDLKYGKIEFTVFRVRGGGQDQNCTLTMTR